MDENTKDVLLVCLGSMASLLGSVIALILQSRRDRQLTRIERREKHFDEVREYLYANSVTFAVVIDYLTTINAGLRAASPQEFQLRINPMLERVNQSRFNGLPNRAITKNQKLIDKLAKVQDYMLDFKIIIEFIGNGRTVDSNGVSEQVKKLEEMNKLIAEILDEMEKEID